MLETLTYLARSHPNVAKLLLFLEFPSPSRSNTEALDQRRGKAVVEDGEEQKAFALVLLLTLLNQPLYMRSVAHLEQVIFFIVSFLVGICLNLFTLIYLAFCNMCSY